MNLVPRKSNPVSTPLGAAPPCSIRKRECLVR